MFGGRDVDHVNFFKVFAVLDLEIGSVERSSIKLWRIFLK